MRGILTTLGAAFLTVILVAAYMVRAPEPLPADTDGLMATAAEAYLGTLSSAERDRGTWKLDAEQRFDWHFIPRERYGVRLKDMNPEQRTRRPRAPAERSQLAGLPEGDRGHAARGDPRPDRGPAGST